MRVSNFFLSTLKEAPAEAELVSHRLMLRAGLIRRLGSGIYSLMPMGLRVARKVEAIVREEMNRAGAVEMSMPVVQPAELWQESGRWQAYGPELLRLKDRHERDFVIQPTSEEVITDIARNEIKSYRQRPVSCQSSAGCTAGISNSTAPARFISSRTTCSTLRSTRNPSGIQV